MTLFLPGRSQKRILKWLLFLIVTGALFYHFAWPKGHDVAGEKSQIDEMEEQQVDERNEFYPVLALAKPSADIGLQLYQAIAKTAEDNILISPYSIYTLMAAIYTGTNSYTEVQTGDVFKFNGFSKPDLLDALQKSHGHIVKQGQDPNLSVVSGVFGGRKKATITSKFKDRLGKYVGATVQDADFPQNHEIIRKSINTWIQEQTKNAIKAVLKKGAVNKRTRLVLVNAATFKGAMITKFKPDSTIAATWHMTNKVSTEVRLMYQAGVFNYGFHKNLNSQLLEFPFVGKQFSMFVILPRTIEGIKLVEKKLTVTDLTTFIPEKMSPRPVQVSFPRFSLVGDIDLIASMQTVGLTDIFDKEKADLSGMDQVGKLHISNFAHKTRVTMGEETGASQSLYPSHLKKTANTHFENFWADHPFLFYIRENRSGNIMFLARYKDPYRIPE